MKLEEDFFNSNLINGLILFLFPSAFQHIFSSFASPELLRTVKNNDYVRLLILYYIIFFFVSTIIPDTEGISKSNKILNELIISFIILIFIILFTRQLQFFNIIQMLILFSIYILHLNEVKYYVIYIFYGLLGFTLLLGFYFYYKKQLKDKGKSFTYQKFLLGNKEKDYEK